MTKQSWEKINELKELLREHYATPDALNSMLSRYLQPGNKRRNGYPIYFCNSHSSKSPDVSINTTGKIGCGCFNCRIWCRNPIDIAQEFGGISDFNSAVIEAAENFGLISSIEGDALREGKDIRYQERPKNVIPPKRKVTFYEQQPYDLKKANVVYRLFSNLRTMSGQPRLTEEALEELHNKRLFDDETIKKIGFFSYPDGISIQYLINAMKKYGLSENDLALIPGFAYNRKTNQWTFQKLSARAYCIPIVNIDNQVTAIQIRFLESNVACKYIWFSSNFGMNTEDSDKSYVKGNSPGTPFTICVPEKITNRSLFITEGFYKAYEFAKTFGCISLSVQGVNNTNGIEYTIAKIDSRYNISNIIIGFDADMATKETVLKPALKLGAKLCEMPDDLNDKFLRILSQGRKTKADLCTNFMQEAREIENFFATSKKYKIYYVVWDLRYEKGIDDLIHSGDKDKIKSMKIEEFWHRSYDIMKAIDVYKFDNPSEDNKNVEVPTNVCCNLFENLLLHYA